MHYQQHRARSDLPKRDPPFLVLPVQLVPLRQRVRVIEDEGSRFEVNAMLLKIALALSFIELEPPPASVVQE